ncbi:MAG: hypothetical protein QXL22_01085 [Candidatus Nezhaarchaeales archaeon]
MAATVKSALDRHLSIVKSTWNKEVSDLKVAGSLLKELKPLQAGLHIVGATVKNITDGLKSHLEEVRGRI